MHESYSAYSKGYWDKAHSVRDGSAIGCADLKAHQEMLHAEVKQGSRVLGIGVGTAEWIRELTLIADVSACDVSTTALAGVADVTTAQYTAPEQFPANTFDLVLCNYVLLHCTDEIAHCLVCRATHSLNPAGLFAVDYLEPLEASQVIDNQVGLPTEPKRASDGTMLRTRQTFLNWVRCAGGTAEVVDDVPMPNYQWGSLPVRRVVVHIRRA